MPDEILAADLGAADTVPSAEDVRRFAASASLEVPPRNVDKFLAAMMLVPQDTEIFLNVLSTTTEDEMVTAAKKISAAGYRPVPHLAARLTPSEGAFGDYVSRLVNDAGVEQVMLVGGDRDVPRGPFDGSAQLLETRLLAKTGIRRAGITGYPEGHPAIADHILDTARRRKFEAAAADGMTLELVTQVCFDPQAIKRWITARRAEGISATIRVGVPGPAKLKTLVQYGAICGVGQSLRMVRRQTRSMAKLLTTSNPDAIVLPLAAEAADPAAGDSIRPHFFSFGGVAATAKYLAALRDGRFDFAVGGGLVLHD